ncbi:MAG: VWA domain-containing protein [Paludibacteraceae bacterium]|nr:VWA domain-containing protein [Paludibacteraceae bacterium]
MLFINKKKHQNNDALPVNDGKIHVFNLIVLDESGSMSVIEQQARSGCNEVLSGIRQAQKEHPNLVQTISLLPFNTGEMKFIYENTPVEETHDIAGEYSPNGCTALYDAMGFALTRLEKETERYEDAVGAVTVITDGEENSSREYSGKMIYDIVERLKQKGWTFAFMGANQDVMKVARSLNIKNAREFDYTGEGMTDAWERERKAKMRHFLRLEHTYELTASMPREEKRKYMAEEEAATDYYAD